MEREDRDLIEQAIKTNPVLRRLYREHAELEELLETFRHRPFLTSVDQLEQKRLKVEKLEGVEQMMRIIRAYRDAPRLEDAA